MTLTFHRPVLPPRADTAPRTDRTAITAHAGRLLAAGPPFLGHGAAAAAATPAHDGRQCTTRPRSSAHREQRTQAGRLRLAACAEG